MKLLSSEAFSTQNAANIPGPTWGAYSAPLDPQLDLRALLLRRGEGEEEKERKIGEEMKGGRREEREGKDFSSLWLSKIAAG